MTTRRQVLKAASAGTILLAGCSGGSVTNANSPGNQTTTSPGETTSGEVETVSESPECSNPSEQSRLVVTPRGTTVIADTQAAADSLTAELDSDVDAKVIETGDGYAVEIRTDSIPLDDFRTYASDQPDLGPVREGVTTSTLTQVAKSVRESLAGSEDIGDYSVYRVRRGESEPNRVVAIVNIRGADGLSPSTDVTFYVNADGERRQLVDKSLLEVTGVTDQDNMVSIQIQLTERGRQQYRTRLMDVVDLEGRVGDVLYIDVDGETVWDGTISPSLADMIQSGEWNGNFQVGFRSSEAASAFTSAVNLIQLSIPAETELRDC